MWNQNKRVFCFKSDWLKLENLPVVPKIKIIISSDGLPENKPLQNSAFAGLLPLSVNNIPLSLFDFCFPKMVFPIARSST